MQGLAEGKGSRGFEPPHCSDPELVLSVRLLRPWDRMHRTAVLSSASLYLLYCLAGGGEIRKIRAFLCISIN